MTSDAKLVHDALTAWGDALDEHDGDASAPAVREARGDAITILASPRFWNHTQHMSQDARKQLLLTIYDGKPAEILATIEKEGFR